MEKTLRLLRSVSLIAFFILQSTTGINAQRAGTIFSDDFSGIALGTLWEKPTSWTTVVQSAYLFDGQNRWLRTSASYTEPSYVIETSAKGFTSSYYREFRVTFGQENVSDHKMYVLSYRPYFGGILTLGLSTDNFYYPQTLDEAVLYPALEADKWYKFKIAKYKSGLIQVFVDEGKGYGTIPFLEAIDTTYPRLGHVSWRVDTETAPESFYVDQIAAIVPTVEKPAVKEKPAEDDLITQVSAKSSRSYKVTKLATGINAYTDRGYTITSFPSHMNGISFLQTPMDDKKVNADSFLTSFLKKDAIVYVGYDPRAKTIPDWLSDWTKTGDRIELTDPGTPYVDVYSKLIEYGQTYPYPFVLGGNLSGQAAGARMNYLLAAVERPKGLVLEAEKATITGAKKRSNHPGYSGTGFVDYINASGEYIEWDATIDIPGTYSIGFGYANGSVADRPLQIAVDGADVSSLQFTPTLSWSSWAFTTGLHLFLSKGVHKIRATTIGSSGPNMDYASLQYMSAAPVSNLKTAEVSKSTNPILASIEQRRVDDGGELVYPNPFRSNTTISYEVTQTARVRLSLLSAQGAEVKLLSNETKQPGRYNVVIDASKLAAGTYFYRLQTGNNVHVGKLIKM